MEDYEFKIFGEIARTLCAVSYYSPVLLSYASIYNYANIIRGAVIETENINAAWATAESVLEYEQKIRNGIAGKENERLNLQLITSAALALAQHVDGYRPRGEDNPEAPDHWRLYMLLE